MAYKQNPGRGKCSPFKNIGKLVSPLKNTGIEPGSVLSKGGNNYEVKSVGSKEVVVSSNGNITRIPLKEAKGLYKSTMEQSSSKQTWEDKPLLEEDPIKKEEMKEGVKTTPQQERIIEFNKFATGKE